MSVLTSIPTLAGVVARTITTSRITSRVLFTGPETGVPVLFLHGNITSATWWEEEVMVSLPGAYRGIASDQRGFGAADPAKKIDATGARSIWQTMPWRCSTIWGRRARTWWGAPWEAW